MRHYRQLTQEQRYQIEGLKKAGYLQKEIAKEVGVSASTISRELRRNRGRAGYAGAVAQRTRNRRQRQARKANKQNTAIYDVIRIGLGMNWSPEQISGFMRRHSALWVSHEWIYRHIEADKRQGGDLHRQLRQSRRRRRKRYGGRSARGLIPNRVGIEERPKCVELRNQIGHWEADTVVGAKHQGALVTLVERKLGYALSAPLQRATAEATADAIIRLLTPYKSLVKTITYDNGKEFSAHERISRELHCKGYFADPYCAWQRGTNENTNGLIRQYFPKGQSLIGVTEEAVTNIIGSLNCRPRKRLGFVTPDELMKIAISSRARTEGEIALIG